MPGEEFMYIFIFILFSFYNYFRIFVLSHLIILPTNCAVLINNVLPMMMKVFLCCMWTRPLRDFVLRARAYSGLLLYVILIHKNIYCVAFKSAERGSGVNYKMTAHYKKWEWTLCLSCFTYLWLTFFEV